MNKTIRATAVVGTTMAFVIAGSAAVAAHGPRDRDEMRGFGGPQMGAQGGFGFGMRDGLGGFRGLDPDIERSERTVQTADGITIARVEKGVVESAAADSLSFTLESGETVTVVVDDDTQAIAFEESEITGNRGWTRTRLVPTQIEAVDIEAGAAIVVWSGAEDGSDFVASRIAVQPVDTDDEPDSTEADQTEADVDATEDGATTDA